MRNRILVLMLIFLALQLVLIKTAQAEYRVYKLGITYSPSAPKEVEVLTTLDNLQYDTFYKLTPTQTTRLIDHWMCYGRTDGFKKYCAKPGSPARSVAQVSGSPQDTSQKQSPGQSPNSKP